MLTAHVAAVAIVCAAAHVGAAQAPGPAPADTPPAVAVRVSDSDWRTYTWRAAADGTFAPLSDDALVATVARVGTDEWELTLKAKKPLHEVWFPWEGEPGAVGGTAADDVVYYPFMLGVAEKAATASEHWWGQVYPGGCFAPLVVLADEGAARMVAATNWPPRPVRPAYCRGRIALQYEEEVAAGAKRTCRALATRVQGDAAHGVLAWHLALDRYKAWLLPHMKEAGLYPIAYAEALRQANGWMQVMLHQVPRFDLGDLREVYNQRKDIFPWIQFWGQMSNYQRSPEDGLSDWPTPALEPGEPTGCCLVRPPMHRRYVPHLPAFAREVVRTGGMVGYYSRPQEPYHRLDTPGSPALAFLKGWLDENAGNGANAFYLDVLGTRDFGDGLAVAQLFHTGLPALSVIEYPVDVYPTAFLVSGSLWGGRPWHTRPGQTPAQFTDRLTRVTFPRFGRYLLDDRILFLGGCNDDWMYWGTQRGHDHWTERQAFLLGAKLDAPTRFKGMPGRNGWIDPVNPIVELIVAEWRRVGWWDRQPVYRDRAGLHDVPADIDVRRFVDRDGATLFVVENWRQRSDRSFGYRGRPIVVPARQLCIMVLPRELEPEPTAGPATGFAGQ